MATPIIEPSFVSGEVTPSLWGREDIERLHSSAATMRNMFVRYTGGSYSRAGTAFVGYSRQTGRSYPPRLLTFQFSINQGLALEWGNYYVRAIYQGAYVTEGPLAITGATQADPLVITVPAEGAISATPNNGAVTSSYAPGDIVAIAGGTFTTQAQLLVDTTELISIQGGVGAGISYAPGDTVTLYGGATSTNPIVTVTTTQVSVAAVVAPGTGGTAGSAVVTGSTGTGTPFSLNVTIGSAGAITGVLGFVNHGSYTVNPSTLGATPVTGGSLSGATVSVAMVPNVLAVTNAGQFTANPPGGNMFQLSSSGAGLGANFINGLFGPDTVSFPVVGDYSAFPTNPAAQAETSGGGAGATFTITWGAVSAYSVGDWLYLQGETGMTQINGRTVVVSAVSGDQFSLQDVYGDNIDSTAFSPFAGGGTAARIYTSVTPYAEEDLPWLKITQSADEMFIGCVNQLSQVEYPPYSLTRYFDSLFLFTELTMQATVNPPSACSGTATAPPTGTTYDSSAYYQYVATAVSPKDGSESVASPIANIPDAVDITVTAGSITVTWSTVPGVNVYNVYKATPVFAGSLAGATVPPPVGAQFGYAGSAYGTQFIDSNVQADFTQVPPTHQNPFARGVVTGATPVDGGTGYTYAIVVVTSLTGTNAILTAVVEGGSVVAFVAQNGGFGYEPGDTVIIEGDGTGATATLDVGAESGTYPASPQFYNQRLFWGYTLDNPDTYNASQPGAFTNFDTRTPTIDSDALSGTPWSQQVNGVQFMIPMPGGLVVLTGLGAWQVTGAGGSSLNPQSITPSNQQAQPQSFNGCSPTIPPLRINFDIIYVQAKGYIYRDLAYQFFTNIYTGTDMTVNSLHLFLTYELKEHAWCEEPYKIIWSVRNDGVLLSCTFLKEQNVLGFARHDTNGEFVTVCSVIEPPVDALYVGTSRLLGENNAPTYVIERMDNRLWTDVESTWCVDCALNFAMPTPDANLFASSADGVGSLTGVTELVGGAGYSSATYAFVVDNDGQGPGSGAVPVLTIAGGIVTAVAFSPAGAAYTYPALTIVDPQGTGSGASAMPALNSQVTFNASASVFSSGNVGDVIRMGNGVATITTYVSGTEVNAQLTTPISDIIPNSGGVVTPQPTGSWSMTTPIQTVSGLVHLAGQTVTGIYDGNPIPPTVVNALGELTLPAPATSITIGLGFQAQFQSVDLDVGAPTVQGQRKKIAAATARVESSRGLKMGSNQPNGSTMNPIVIAPEWQDLDDVPDLIPAPYNSGTAPLYTGDVRVPVQGGYQKPGQVCLQQDYPLPMNILALIPEVLMGDKPEQEAKPRQKER
jgi:hypothetical protein